jgi:hypothetical protein
MSPAEVPLAGRANLGILRIGEIGIHAVPEDGATASARFKNDVQVGSK